MFIYFQMYLKLLIIIIAGINIVTIIFTMDVYSQKLCKTQATCIIHCWYADGSFRANYSP